MLAYFYRKSPISESRSCLLYVESRSWFPAGILNRRRRGRKRGTSEKWFIDMMNGVRRKKVDEDTKERHASWKPHKFFQSPTNVARSEKSEKMNFFTDRSQRKHDFGTWLSIWFLTDSNLMQLYNNIWKLNLRIAFLFLLEYAYLIT